MLGEVAAAAILAVVWLVPGSLLLAATPLWYAIPPAGRLPVAAATTLAIGTPGTAAYLLWPQLGLWGPGSALLGVAGAAALLLARRGRAQQEKQIGEGWEWPGHRGWTLLTLAIAIVCLAIGMRTTGDSAYHLGILHRMLEIPQLGQLVTSRFVDGTLNPTYAMPLWHGFLALTARLAGGSPETTFVASAAVVAPVATLAWAAAAARVVGSAAQLPAAVGFALTHLLFAGGDLDLATSLAYPGFVTLYVVLPVVLLLLWESCWGGARNAARVALAAAIGVVVVLHANYLLYVALALLGYCLYWLAALARRASRSEAAVRAHLWTGGTALAAAAISLGAVIPVLRRLAHFGQGTEGLTDEWRRYGGTLFVGVEDAFHLAPGQLVAFGGASAAAAAGIALLAFRYRRPGSWIALGLSGLVVLVALCDAIFMAVLGIGSATAGLRIFRALPIAIGLAALVTVPLESASARGAGRARFALPALATAMLALATLFFEPLVNVHGGESVPPAGLGVAAATAIAAGGATALVLVACRGLVRERRDRARRRLGVAATALLLFGLSPQIVQQAPALGDELMQPSWHPPSDRPGTPVGSNRARWSLPSRLADSLRRLPTGTVVLADPVTAWDIQGLAAIYSAGDYKHWLVPTDRNRPKARYGWVRSFAYDDVPDKVRYDIITQVDASYVLLNPDQRRARAFARRAHIDGSLELIGEVDGWRLLEVQDRDADS